MYVCSSQTCSKLTLTDSKYAYVSDMATLYLQVHVVKLESSTTVIKSRFYIGTLLLLSYHIFVIIYLYPIISVAQTIFEGSLEF